MRKKRYAGVSSRKKSAPRGALESAIKCNKCGKVFYPGMTDGMPNGVALIDHSGQKITFCYSCVCEYGALKPSDRFAWMELAERNRDAEDM